MPKRHLSLVVIMTVLIIFFLPFAYGMEYVASFGGVIRSSVVYKGYAYLAQRDTIRILDIRDKNKIHEIGTYIDPGIEIGHIAIKYPVLYYEMHFRSEFHDVGAVDISDLAHPRKLESNFLCRRATQYDLEIKGSWLRIRVDGSDEGWIYDITDPFNPAIKARDEEDSNAAISAMNMIKTPAIEKLPSIPKEIVYAGYIKNVKTEGKRVYVLDEEKSVKVIDVSDPKEPKYVGVAPDSGRIRRTMAVNHMDWQSSVTINKKYAIEARRSWPSDGFDGAIVSIRGISNSASPRLIDDSMRVEYNGHDQFNGFRVLDSLLLVLSECHRTSLVYYGLSIFNIKNIENPEFVDAYPKYSNGFECGDRIAFESEPGGISADGRMIYIASQDNGLSILRYTNQENP